MNLRKLRNIFITDSVWIALADERHPDHEDTQQRFKQLLDDEHKLMTSSYVVDWVIEHLKSNVDGEAAKRFFDIIERATVGNYLKVFWLSRRLRTQALEAYLNEDFKRLSRALNITLIKQKNVHAVLTLHPDIYTQFHLPCMSVRDD